MAAGAIDTVQLQLILERRSRHEALQFRHPHVRDILEDHVLPHRFHRRVDFRAGKPEPFHDRFRHLGADPVVTIETNPTFLIYDGRRRFGYIVKQNAEYER